MSWTGFASRCKCALYKVLYTYIHNDNIILCRYQCIENDLLYPLQRATHNIAPYKSKGLERASELSICWDSDQSLSVKTNPEGSYTQRNSTANGSGTYIGLCSSDSIFMEVTNK